VYVKVSPALFVGLAYDFTTLDISGRSSAQTQTRYQQVSLQVDEFLSKRTDVYAEAIYEHAAGDAMASGLAGGAVAQIYPNKASSGQNQVLLRVAMRHRF
jgi:predicted porin